MTIASLRVCALASLAAFAIGAGAVLEAERRIGRSLARALNP